MAKLIFSGEHFSGRVYELVLEKTTVGRGDQNTLVIRDSSVSMAHCEILMHGPEIIVRDLDSSNGTFVNGTRLNKQSQVKSGQTIRFGSVEVRLELDPGKDGLDETEITAVYTMGKIMREQERAKKQPNPVPSSMQAEPGVSQPTGDHTTMVLKANPPRPSAPLSQSGQNALRPEPRSKVKPFVIAALVLAGLALILWLIWGRK